MEGQKAGVECLSMFAEGNRRSRRVSDIDKHGTEANPLALLYSWCVVENAFPVPV
jgi:hypothetical protein